MVSVSISTHRLENLPGNLPLEIGSAQLLDQKVHDFMSKSRDGNEHALANALMESPPIGFV